MGNAQPGEHTAEQGLGIVGAHAKASGAAKHWLAAFAETPGVGRREYIPIQTVMPGQFAGAQGRAVALQVRRAGAGDANHRRQRGRHQARIGEWADA